MQEWAVSSVSFDTVSKILPNPGNFLYSIEIELPQFSDGTRGEAADRGGRGILGLCGGAKRIVHDYSRRDGIDVVMMKYNGSDGIILVRRDGVWLWQGGGLSSMG